jgi:hypothetical protein
LFKILDQWQNLFCPQAWGGRMGRALTKTGLAAICGIFLATEVLAAPIVGSACLLSKRRAATGALCSCIQRVADQSLRDGDQRRVAGFFRNPDNAQEVFMSKKKADDAFWLRYKAFVAQAEQSCG